MHLLSSSLFSLLHLLPFIISLLPFPLLPFLPFLIAIFINYCQHSLALLSHSRQLGQQSKRQQNTPFFPHSFFFFFLTSFVSYLVHFTPNLSYLTQPHTTQKPSTIILSPLTLRHFVYITSGVFTHKGHPRGTAARRSGHTPAGAGRGRISL